MKTDKDMLSSILKTTQMGQIGIRSISDMPMSKGLKEKLDSQLREYDAIETQAHDVAQKMNLKVKELNPGVRSMSEMMAKSKLAWNCNDSKIAAMMIQGNTRGIIKGLKNIHRYREQDSQVSELSQKLLDCENENIQQMKSYL